MHRLIALAFLVSACKSPVDTDTETDADTDADTDSDTDADADTDTDTDADTDTDSDTDSDTDTDPACAGDDPDEPNDTVLSAVPRTDGTDLVVCATSEDFWSMQVPGEQAIEVAIDFVQADGDLDLLLTHPTLGDLAISQSETDGEAVLWVNEAPFATDVVARVYGYSGASNTYALSTVVHDCPADADEPNDTPTEAIAALSATDRTVDSSPDVFALGTIAPEDALTVTFDYDPLLGDVLLELIGIDGSVLASQPGGSGPLAWNNPSLQALEVFARFSLVQGFCGKLDFEATVVSPEPEICDDTVDNDLDGWTDCDDYSCLAFPGCVNVCPLDDSGEDNDAPGEASAFPEAVDYLTHVEDPDWFLVVLGVGEYAAVDVQHAPVDDAVRVLAQTTDGALVVEDVSQGGAALLEWFNDTSVPQTYFVGVEVASGGVCSTYTITYATGPLPPEVCGDGADNDLDQATDCADYDCLEHPSCSGVCPPEDPLEDNDTPEDAIDAPDGTDLMAHRQDPDHYRVILTPGNAATVALTNTTSGADLDLSVLLDGEVVAESATVNPIEEVRFANQSSSDQTYVVKVAPAPGTAPCGGYDLAQVIAAIPAEDCQDTVDNDFDGFTDCDDYDCLAQLACSSTCPTEDAREDNDTRATAAPDANGTNLMVHPQDPDWFSTDVGPGESATVTLEYLASNGNLTLRIEDPLGFPILDSDDASDLVIAQWVNPTPTTQTYLVGVRTSVLGEQCNDYDLTTEVLPAASEVCDDLFDNDGDGVVDCEDADCIGEEPACGCGIDIYDGNHEPLLAAALPVSTTGLVVPVQGGDWFETTVPAGATLQLGAVFEATEGTASIRLFAADATLLASSMADATGASVTWTNPASVQAGVYVQIALEEGVTNPSCLDYDLVVQ